MDLLIDSNIILDFILSREPFNESAEKVLELGFKTNIKEYISAASVTDIYYIANRTLKNSDLVNALITGVLNSINVASVHDKEIRYALNLHWKDFEDAVQFSVAKFNDMDAIVTRNMKGFKNSELTYSPRLKSGDSAIINLRFC